MTADLIAVVLLLAVAAYACGGGTDYGAGFWDLTAGGAESGKRPRWLIDHAMAPVWEVNNVWLIFVLVIMWTGFPILFQTVFSAMWLPLALAAMGLVLRGAGFAFRKPSRRLAGRRLYGAMFAVASVVTPFFLGAAVGGVASGRAAQGTEASADAWSNPTSLMFGLVAIATTALLGAVFLTADARRFDAPDLVGYFRLRALSSLAVLTVLAVITGFVTHEDSPTCGTDSPTAWDCSSSSWPGWPRSRQPGCSCGRRASGCASRRWGSSPPPSSPGVWPSAPT